MGSRRKSEVRRCGNHRLMTLVARTTPRDDNNNGENQYESTTQPDHMVIVLMVLL
jgi:hypothetical protein